MFKASGLCTRAADYEKEAANGARFEESLGFLGFVTTPVVVPEYSSKKVLVTEWVQGGHLSALPAADGLRMTRMAVEACTASLVLTGYVHADPHEGNVMLGDDGRLVFLDFGLMSEVDPEIMEAFARGIQACLAEDWTTLAIAFKDTGFLNNPIQYKKNAGSKDAKFEAFGVDPETGVDLGLAQFSAELGQAMSETEGGTSRFGALATVLNQRLAPRWKMFTPPYVLLLIRTFLTLEGIAERVDPEFNIYEMAMPWAVRRSLSPASAEGVESMRATLLQPDNRVQWDRLLGLVEEVAKKDAAEKQKDAAEVASSDDASSAAGSAEEQRAKAQATESAKTQAMNDAVGSLLGSSAGSALRRTLRDLDSTDLAERLVSKEGRQLRHAAALAISSAMAAPFKARRERAAVPKTEPVGRVVPTGGNAQSMPRTSAGVTRMLSALRLDRLAKTRNAEAAAAETSTDDSRPVSEKALQLRERQARWKSKVTMMLVSTHVRRQLASGKRGLLALTFVGYLAVRIALGAVRQLILQTLGGLLRFGRRAEGDEPPAVALA